MGNRLEEIIRTAVMMGLHGLPSKFVEDAARVAMDYDGIYDLMVMWREEVDSGECRKIVDTIQELLDNPILAMERRMKRRMKRGGIADKCRSQTLAKEITNTTDSILKSAGMRLSNDPT